jgi:hypothetical protein
LSYYIAQGAIEAINSIMQLSRRRARGFRFFFYLRPNKQGHARKFFLLDQFDLTPAEQYLTDEFASRLSTSFTDQFME